MKTQGSATTVQNNKGKLVLLFAAIFIELVGYFMLSPLLTITLHNRGETSTLIGVFSAMSWLALLIGAPFSATWVNKLGMQTTLRLCAVLPLLAAVSYNLTTHLAVWFVVSFIASMSSALRWICSEAVVADLTHDGNRARWVSAYSMLIGLTFILGPILLSVIGTQGQAAWVISTGLIATGAVLTFFLFLPKHDVHEHAHNALKNMWALAKANPFFIVTGVFAGFFEVGLNGILPLLGLTLGMDEAQATRLVSFSAIGGIVGVVCSGWIKTKLLFSQKIQLCIVLLCLACAVQWLAPWLAVSVWIAVFFWGAAGGAMYILSMTELGTQYKSMQLVQYTSLLVMAYTIGGLCAPALGGVMLDLTRTFQAPIFSVFTSAFAVLGVFLIYRIKPKAN